ncbi:MAG: NADH-quinone oxidoreductase subunit NuoG [Solirubrobacterales bacterium]|nr:NADH-quinone oxidoreductase subunit NuoG [Solirubrobacterales bacterium]
MPRPERKTIQLTIDGREVSAIEGAMLVDAAKRGDVEIPYFCYEPKLGAPVGACRMCLVEIEGIPKLQTSCSTPVKDGMVVHTQTDRVRHAQNAVVEFLLINHPLDCPVCDKGGECPLQDITFGWGLGRSRMIEPKRHFQKPLALSPLVAIDRERCILCYRCVRFSQEIAEDYQLIFAERGAHTFVATHDGHPYVAPFSGNIVELCPVGALTSQPYRFRARPWDIEAAGGVCTLCPSQCNVSFTVRDERVVRVLSRQNPEVDDGWLCDKGRFGYQAMHVDERITRPLVREAGELREVSWERALNAAAQIAKHRGRIGALVGGQASNEEGFVLQRLMREALRSSNIDSRASAHHAPIGAELARSLAAPELQATMTDVEFAHTVLLVGCDPRDDAPILDLRIRKGVRRHGVKLAIATARPTALERNATLIDRYVPGGDAAFLHALDRALTLAPGATGHGDLERLVALLREGGEDVVIVYSERIGAAGAAALRRIAEHLGLAGAAGAGLLALPVGANGRGLREAGAVPDAGPGYAVLPAEQAGRGTREIGAAAAAGELTALYLMQTDPVRDEPDRALWQRALRSAALVVAHASVLTEGLREHATVILPAESYAEKDGTVVHPDGRLQRLRVAIARPGEVRAGWWVLAELTRRCGLELQISRSADAFRQLAGEVPVYDGITLEGIAGHGLSWPPRPASVALSGGAAPDPVETPPAAPASAAGLAEAEQLALGTYRPIWASPEVEVSPALKYLISHQQLELSPHDALRLRIGDGDQVIVAQPDDSPAAQSGEAGRREQDGSGAAQSDEAGRRVGRKPEGNGEGTQLAATALVRSNVPAGSAFLADGIAVASGNSLAEPLIEVRRA